MLEDGYMTIKAQTCSLITCIMSASNTRVTSASPVFGVLLQAHDRLTNALKDRPHRRATTIASCASDQHPPDLLTPPRRAPVRAEGNDMATREKPGILLETHHLRKGDQYDA